MTEHDDYATLGSITPTSSSVGMFVRPKTKSVSSYGSHMPKGKVEGERVVSTSSHPIIGESAAMFTDMTDTMLKVLDRRMAAAAQAHEIEDTLAENAYALDQKRQSTTGHSLSSHPSYMNTVLRTTNVGIPIAVSTLFLKWVRHYIDLFLLHEYVTFWTLWQLNKLEPNI